MAETDKPLTARRYVIATKRDRRGRVPTAVERVSGIAAVLDTANPNLILVESMDDIGTLRSKIGTDHFVEPEIFYQMMSDA